MLGPEILGGSAFTRREASHLERWLVKQGDNWAASRATLAKVMRRSDDD
ncbi:hypothetical protein [Micromonospora chersina]